MKINIFKFFQPVVFLLISINLSAQSSITFKVSSLKPGDSCTVYVQKSAEVQYYKIIKSGNDSIATYKFDNLSNGKWEVKIDATGYYFPTSKVVELNANNKLVEVRLSPVVLNSTTNYFYQWKDDSSYVGHAQQSYINTPYSIQVLNSTITIPDDFSSVTLYNKYGIVLSNELSRWTNEDAYRLFMTVSRNSLFQTFGEGSPVKVNSVWKIVDTDITDDIKIETIDNIKFVTISKKAFVYANPSVGILDGIKGRFFSKRLNHAVVAYSTNFGYDKDLINRLALERYGFKFLIPNDELKQLMSEDYSNFQEFSAFEKITILDMIEELPEGMHSQTNLKFLVRRIAGQVNPKYPQAAAVAWTGLKTIEFMNSAFQGNDYFNIQRLVLHEKSHFLWAGLFDKKLKDDWADLGGWRLDPTVSSGWSTTKTTEFVSAYSHANNPDEDMAESISFYVMNPDLLMSRSIRKFEFIRDRIMNGTRYVAMIRQDLTFMVYNLFPDYNYPGKIKRVDVKVEGKSNEDKKITLEIELNIIDSARDGASSGYTRFASSIGTIFDVGLSPVDKNGYILRGQITISKFFKSGYWTVNQIMVSDAVGNKRYENNNTFGLKLFLDNPLEDLLPPVYIDNTLKLGKGISKFSGMGPGEDANGISTQYVEAKFDLSDKNAITYIGTNYAIPKLDEKGVKSELQLGVLGVDTRYYKVDSANRDIKHITYRYPIPEYFPKGFYELTMMYLVDEGGNPKRAFFMNDTASFKIGAGDLKTSKHVRDSIYIDTKYPDFIPPILDVNAITIKATPTNPKAPDGETLFEMEFFAKDSSAYLGNEAGVKHGGYILRDPQGKQHGFSMQNDFDKIKGNFYYLVADPDGKPGYWRKYKVSTLLPKGSSPGLWGVESMDLIDRANNTKRYSFVELVRFDIEEKDSSQKVNPIIEILGKKVNAKNVDSVSLSISCKTCAQKNYRARIYSDMGGESVLYEGVMDKDSIVVKNIKLKGVNDGTLYATVFVLDTAKVLLGIGKAQYTKDVVAPKSSILKTNLSNFGKSNIDSLIFDMKVSELNCEYTLVLTQSSIVKTSAINAPINSPINAAKIMSIKTSATAVGDSVVFNGKLTDSVFKLQNIKISNFEDGLIELKIIIKDSLGNETIPVKTNIYKDTKEPIITIKKSTITDLKATYTIESNEFLSNSLIKDSLKINIGKIDSIAKVGNKLYNVFITRVCNDTLILTVKPNSLMDTVGNKNLTTSITGIEKLIPDNPSVTGLNYCQGAGANQLTANILTGHNSVWYSSSSGTTSSTTAPKPITTNIGKVDYYVSQVKATTGCESSKTKLTVTVFEIPAAPILSRDTANFLVSSATSGNTWYKDSAVLKDSAQRIKPLTPGAYNVKTTQNGCISAISSTYYFLVTDILKLSSTEFIKLAPNPFQTKLNFDFLIKGYQKMNLDVFEISTGNRVASRIGLMPGAPIYLPELTSGTYIIKITSADGKLSYQFKMVKM